MHGFKASQLDILKCAVCHRDERAHTTLAQCESCPAIGPCELFPLDNDPNSMLMCKAKCYPAEVEAHKINNSPEKQQERLEEQSRLRRLNQMNLEELKSVDTPNLDGSIFNAKTLALVDMLRAIDDSPEIPSDKKNSAKAEFAVNRFKSLQDRIIQREQDNSEDRTEQKAIHVYLNEIAKHLREDEKTAIHLQDINYPVSASKPKKQKVDKPKPEAKPRKPKINFDEVRKWANLCDVTMEVIQMRMIAQNMNEEQAGRSLAQKLGINLSGV